MTNAKPAPVSPSGLHATTGGGGGNGGGAGSETNFLPVYLGESGYFLTCSKQVALELQSLAVLRIFAQTNHLYLESFVRNTGQAVPNGSQLFRGFYARFSRTIVGQVQDTDPHHHRDA
uniref:Uncharacterized protein n=1 Tax=Anopheles coluzzii TaxID=1518534 RepID=A0A8W7P9C8_ANOCL